MNKVKGETFRKKLIKMHEEDGNKHALQWFLNDIIELHEEEIKELRVKLSKLQSRAYSFQQDIAGVIRELDKDKQNP